MGLKLQTARTAQPWKILLTIVCALLVLVGCTVQVAHTHADGTVNHADCSLCAAVHSGVQAAASTGTAPVVVAVSTYLEIAPEGTPASSVSIFALFTRPPPASVSPA